MSVPIFRIQHLLAVFVLSTGLVNHVIIIPLLLNASGRDAWLSILLTTGPVLLWLAVLIFIVKKTEQKKLFEWLEEKYGKVVAYIVTAPFLIYVAACFFITFKDTITWIDSSYLLLTPNIVVSIIFLLMVLIMANSGLQSIIYVSVILLPLVSAFGFFVATGNIPEKDHSLLFPLFEFGWSPIFQGMVYVWGGLFEMIFILFVQHRVKGKIKFMHLFFLALILLGLTLGPTIGAITEFGPYDAMKQRYPAFEQWRLLTIGQYIEHLDVLSFFQWMSGAFIRLTFLLFVMVEFFTNEKHRYRFRLLAGVVGFFIAINFIPLSDNTFFQFMMNAYYPSIVIFSCFVTILLLVLIFVRSRNRKGDKSEQSQNKAF